VHERYRRQTDRRQTDDRQTDGRATAYSEREREFTFAKKSCTTLNTSSRRLSCIAMYGLSSKRKVLNDGNLVLIC